MNKRDTLLNLLDPSLPQGYIPAAFFLHFDPIFHRGQAAVDKHLEYFRHTGMDFVKIQYEHKFPRLEHIRRPEDWANMPLYKDDFFAEPLDVAAGLVKAAGSEALVLMTLYSPFMCAGHTAGHELLTHHIEQDAEAVCKGMEIITESLMTFVQGCIERGVDGFYHSTQGGESGRFSDPSLFEKCVKPYDLVLMNEIERRCNFNILHVCDYNGAYNDLTPFLDYPGHVVNCPHLLDGKVLKPAEVARIFGRPAMGGLDRHGALAHGSPEEIRREVGEALKAGPGQFILGADCTVPGDTPWDNLKLAIATAHEYN